MNKLLILCILCALYAPCVSAQSADLVSAMMDEPEEDTKKSPKKEQAVAYETEKSDDQVADDRGIFSFLNFSFIKKPLSLFTSDDEDEVSDETQGEEQPKETPLERKIRRAKEGNLEAQLVLGYMYLYGENGVESDYEKAFEFYRMAADQKDPVALNNLGSLYFNGIGTKRDYPKAAQLFQAAADNGSEEAAVNLAFIYLSSKNNESKRVDAVKLLMQAAEKGNKTAQFMLGYAYYKGFQVAKDDHKAVALMKEAASAEFDEAEYVLAQMYLKGSGIAQNYGNAVRYLNAAQIQGNMNATVQLADILAVGDVYPKDLVMAHILYNIAAAENVQDAATRRDEVRKSLKIEELLEAQTKAENFKPSPTKLTNYIRQTFGQNIRRYIDTNMDN